MEVVSSNLEDNFWDPPGIDCDSTEPFYSVASCSRTTRIACHASLLPHGAALRALATAMATPTPMPHTPISSQTLTLAPHVSRRRCGGSVRARTLALPATPASACSFRLRATAARDSPLPSLFDEAFPFVAVEWKTIVKGWACAAAAVYCLSRAVPAAGRLPRALAACGAGPRRRSRAGSRSRDSPLRARPRRTCSRRCSGRRRSGRRGGCGSARSRGCLRVTSRSSRAVEDCPRETSRTGSPTRRTTSRTPCTLSSM